MCQISIQKRAFFLFAQISLLLLVLGIAFLYSKIQGGMIQKAITFDWIVLQTSSLHHWTTFWKFFSGIPHLPTFWCTWHLAPDNIRGWILVVVVWGGEGWWVWWWGVRGRCLRGNKREMQAGEGEGITNSHCCFNIPPFPFFQSHVCPFGAGPNGFALLHSERVYWLS